MSDLHIDPVEPGQVLLHIGMYKAGTTAIQNAAAALREELREHDVIYPGKSRNHARASLAIAGRQYGWTGKAPDLRYWNAIVEAVNEDPQSIGFVSHEYFAEYSTAVCQKVATGLKRPVKVVVTVRNLISLPTSMWQQVLKFGTTAPLDEWIKQRILDDSKEEPDLFRTRMLGGEAVAKWADVVGPENVIVVIVDKATPDLLMNSFEELLHLPHGFLTQLELDAGQLNRSMTANEVEFLRATNAVVKAKQTLGWSDYSKLYRHGAIEKMLAHPEADSEPQSLKVPEWTVEPLQAIAQEQIALIRQTGVKVIGDLDSIGKVPRNIGVNPKISTIPVSLASDFVANAAITLTDEIDRLDADMSRLAQQLRRRFPAGEPSPLDDWPTRKILQVGLIELSRRMARRARRVAKRLRSKG